MDHSEQANATILKTNSPAETEALGERLGASLRPGDLIALAGELGAGKTCLVRGLARGWGAQERPTSPTFTLINEYHQKDGLARMYHVDCYRLEDARDAWSTGLEDVLASGEIVVIEWPERVREILPTDLLWIEIDSTDENSRELRLKAAGSRAGELMAALASG
jgi:tRNA threonylcarbamoyladenosine biosynthesis protein TsaE